MPKEIAKRFRGLSPGNALHFTGPVGLHTMFRVEIRSDHSVPAPLGGRLRKHDIRILPGDKVKLELSPYDLTGGRITFRL